MNIKDHIQGPNQILIVDDGVPVTRVFYDYAAGHIAPDVEVRVCCHSDEAYARAAQMLRQIADELPDYRKRFEAERERVVANIEDVTKRLLRELQSIDMPAREKQEAVRVFGGVTSEPAYFGDIAEELESLGL